MATATRLFIPQDLRPGAAVPLQPDQAHYLGRVLRLAPGAELAVFNGRDGEWLARIADLAKTQGSLDLQSQTRPQAAGSDLWLAFAPVKKTQTDFIVQKATELGVSRLIPILTERTQAERVKTDRLQATAIEAAEQSERLDVPDVCDPVRLEKLIRDWPQDRRGYFCAEAGKAQPLAQIADGNGPVGFVTGPEGGFSATELDFMRKAQHFQAVGLGPRILRAETAALAALAIWQAVAGDGAVRPPHRDGSDC